MAQAHRNRLLPWWIGGIIVLIADAFVAWQLFFCGCPGLPLAKALVVIVLPAVYLALMYLTLTSQE
jgi:hypothetical protein